MSKYNFFLSESERLNLISLHHHEGLSKYADRIKVVLWLNHGLSFKEISDLLFLNNQIIHNYISRYQSNGTAGLLSDNYNGYAGKEKQAKFINALNIFMDISHPQHNSISYYGWIYKGEQVEIPLIYVFANNAKYCCCKKMKEFLKNSKIQLYNLPPYSPNLNIIEWLWKFFHKIVLYNKYYETCQKF